ncbi:MAG: SPFH domain-containing protein, partial [Planctomycetota bacterium]
MSDDHNDFDELADESNYDYADQVDSLKRYAKNLPYLIGLATILLIGFFWFAYTNCRISVPERHIAVLTRKTGKDLENGQEVAPDESHKGLQLNVLSEGRYFYNPYFWNWKVYPMVEIPRDKMGVRVRLYGDDLPYGDFIAKDENHKGIIEEVLKPGRYPINAMVVDRETRKEIGGNRSARSDYVEIIELWSPKVIPAGYKGMVTNLAGPMPDDPNTLLVPQDRRGPQKETMEPRTYYLNPYIYRINSIDTRSQRFNLSQGKDMFFPSKDGFPISLDGIIEFRVIPETAALTYVTYNDVTNDAAGSSDISQEIIKKVIMPNARAFCRLRGSNTSAREFIGGETRTAFQADFQAAITETCRSQGIEIGTLLSDLGAIDEAGHLTPHGADLARQPTHPRLAHMIASAGNDAPLAGLIAALMTERPRLPGANALRHLEAALGRGGDLRLDKPVRTRLLDEARRLTRARLNTDLDLTQAGRLAAMAWPDRIALRRPGDDARYLMSGGRGATIDAADPLAAERLLVVLDVEDGREARIRQALPIAEAELRDVLGRRIVWRETAEWSPRKREVQARRRECLGAIALADQHWRDVPPEKLGLALLDGIRERGISALPFNKTAQAARSRVLWLAANGGVPGHALPDWSDSGLLDAVDEWLLPHIGGMRRIQ